MNKRTITKTNKQTNTIRTQTMQQCQHKQDSYVSSTQQKAPNTKQNHPFQTYNRNKERTQETKQRKNKQANEQ